MITFLHVMGTYNKLHRDAVCPRKIDIPGCGVLFRTAFGVGGVKVGEAAIRRHT
jgi:hypothetical protein